MSALDELHRQCERRGWRVALSGVCPGGTRLAGLQLMTVDVKGRLVCGRRDLLARVSLDSAGSLDGAALDCAEALARQGLLT